MGIETRPNFSEEVSKIESERAKLKSTEGWNKLTERQQNILEKSFNIQARAERISDKASAEAVVSPKRHYVKESKILDEEHLQQMHDINDYADPKTRKYRKSQNHIADWYCHAAISNLETPIPLDEPPGRDLPENFFKAEYTQVKDYEELKKRIEEFGYPSVVHISQAEKNFDLVDLQVHSFLVLGKNQNDEIIIWDKQGYMLSYRAGTLQEIYNEYNQSWNSWGIKKLTPEKHLD